MASQTRLTRACDNDKPTQPAVEDVKRQTRSVYETHAAAWDAQRNRSLFERSWLDPHLVGLVGGQLRIQSPSAAEAIPEGES